MPGIAPGVGAYAGDRQTFAETPQDLESRWIAVHFRINIGGRNRVVAKNDDDDDEREEDKD